jgi:hypothetical protein
MSYYTFAYNDQTDDLAYGLYKKVWTEKPLMNYETLIPGNKVE